MLQKLICSVLLRKVLDTHTDALTRSPLLGLLVGAKKSPETQIEITDDTDFIHVHAQEEGLGILLVSLNKSTNYLLKSRNEKLYISIK